MKPRVLYCIPAYNCGGIESNTEYICRFSDDLGFNDFGLCVERQKEDPDFSVYRTANWEVYILDRKLILHPLKYLSKMISIIKNGKYNIIHSFNESRSPIYYLAAIICGVKIRVYHPRTTRHDKGWYRHIGVFLSKLLSTKHCACSENVGRFTFGNSNFEIINDMIDTDKYLYSFDTREELRIQLGIREDEVLIGHIGRFCVAKNHSFILDIYKELLNMGYKARLVLVGDGELYEDINKQAMKLGIHSEIIFLGRRNDAYRIYSALDLFLFPSVYEGYPNTLIEAQASGLKCLISDVITKDIEITNLIERMSLSMPAREWAKKISTMNLNSYDRKNEKLAVIEAGNDARTETEHLLRLYQNWCN